MKSSTTSPNETVVHKCIGCKRVVTIHKDYQCYHCYHSSDNQFEKAEPNVKELYYEQPTYEEIMKTIHAGEDTPETWNWKRKLEALRR